MISFIRRLFCLHEFRIVRYQRWASGSQRITYVCPKCQCTRYQRIDP